jgi:hypothetical protein
MTSFRHHPQPLRCREEEGQGEGRKGKLDHQRWGEVGRSSLFLLRPEWRGIPIDREGCGSGVPGERRRRNSEGRWHMKMNFVFVKYQRDLKM